MVPPPLRHVMFGTDVRKLCYVWPPAMDGGRGRRGTGTWSKAHVIEGVVVEIRNWYLVDVFWDGRMLIGIP